MVFKILILFNIVFLMVFSNWCIYFVLSWLLMKLGTKLAGESPIEDPNLVRMFLCGPVTVAILVVIIILDMLAELFFMADKLYNKLRRKK